MDRSGVSLLLAVFAAAGILVSCDETTNPATPPDAGASLDTNSYGVPWNPDVVYGVLKDGRDGRAYRTVKIGTQTWMAQNLNYAVDSSWWYDNSADSGAKYGRLYQWAGAMGLSEQSNLESWSGTLPWRGICPEGWHLPSDLEWSTLLTSVDSATSSIKLKSDSGWSQNVGTDEYGFRVLPGGTRQKEGTFWSVRDGGSFWTSSQVGPWAAKSRHLNCVAKGVSSDMDQKGRALSVRCLKD